MILFNMHKQASGEIMLFSMEYWLYLFSWTVGLNLGPGTGWQVLYYSSAQALGLYCQHPLLFKLFSFRQGLII